MTHQLEYSRDVSYKELKVFVPIMGKKVATDKRSNLAKKYRSHNEDGEELPTEVDIQCHGVDATNPNPNPNPNPNQP